MKNIQHKLWVVRATGKQSEDTRMSQDVSCDWREQWQWDLFSKDYRWGRKKKHQKLFLMWILKSSSAHSYSIFFHEDIEISIILIRFFIQQTQKSGVLTLFKTMTCYQVAWFSTRNTLRTCCWGINLYLEREHCFVLCYRITGIQSWHFIEA